MREAEERLFSSGADSWWDETGPFRLLHAVNPLRLRYAAEAVGGTSELEGRRLLDLGCGGGIFSEAAARAGAQVVGVDINDNAVAAARAHADAGGLAIEYAVCDSAEAARRWTGRFELVVCFEMLEHLERPAATVADVAALLAPGGRAVFSTVNRTLRARLLMIGLLERALKILPHGAHDWRMFIRPSELADMCNAAGLRTRDVAGLRYSPRRLGFVLDRGEMSVNYFLTAQRTD